ncbi:hypothetical protein PL263_12450 [Methylomonas sp. EFPC3]|nr:hypothetical protein [Methylomonas sp. EFPC3]WFP48916.1 hypothetical protein PL263_12450 [Methylomonas sp. EFPC3]
MSAKYLATTNYRNWPIQGVQNLAGFESKAMTAIQPECPAVLIERPYGR